MAAEEVKLLKTWSSPFGLRAVWGLKLKGIQYEFVDEDLSNKSDLLLQSNPVHKKIPVLIHHGKPIAESFVVLEYIDETWKHNPLLPADPHGKAKARFWAKFSDDKLIPSLWGILTTENKDLKEGCDLASENLKFLEEELKGKDFFAGDKIGFTDLALGWLTFLVPVVEEVLESTLIDKQQFPLLCSWMQRFSEVPVIKESLPPHDKLVVKYRALREKFLLSPPQ